MKKILFIKSMKINLLYKNIAILWFGKEGESTLRFLQKNGIKDWAITILDKNQDIKIDHFEWNIISWDSYLSHLDEFDYIFKSPGVSPYISELLPYKEKILTQTKIFYEYYRWNIISITQTKWKSTTATLCYKLLKNAGYHVKLVGNIWNPVLDEIDVENDVYDFIVYELSSYMLEDLENHHSMISIFWNIFPDHLDWHKNFTNYFNAKKNITKWADNIFVGLGLYPKIKNKLIHRKFFTFGSKWAYYSHIWNTYFKENLCIPINISPRIPGNHNLDNIASIVWVADLLKIDGKILETTINEFGWLPHRLQNIWTFAGITFIDDAISTTPESTIEAIKTFPHTETIFLWWTDRWYDFNELSTIIEHSNIKNIVLFPESGEKIKKSLKIGNYSILETSSMEHAIAFTFQNTQKWNICLLSTASPSYFLWKNFEAKWDAFKNEVFKQYKKFEQ